jgi:hypothetical protein
MTAAGTRTAIRRRRPRRETATSPARLDEASSPLKAAMASVKANSTSSVVGVPPMASGSVNTRESNSSASPSTTISSCSAMSAITITAVRS